MQSITHQLLGTKFHKWTVIKFLGYEKYKATWLCQCECGAQKKVKADQLLAGINPRCAVHPRNGQTVERGMNPYGRLISVYRYNARQRNIEFSLTDEEARKLFQGNCRYCDASPSQIFKVKPYEFKYNGIDRVDNVKGYSKENSVSCCGTCNFMKGTQSEDEFFKQIQAIYSVLSTNSKDLYQFLPSLSK